MDGDSIRLDKWLWFARVVKTRTLAQKLVRSHKIRLNREKISNPAKAIGAGDVLTIVLERQIRVLEVVACGKRRGPYREAVKLFIDLSPPTVPGGMGQMPEQHNWERAPRPDKYGRRKLMELKRKQQYQ